MRADSDQDLRAKERNSLADQLAAARQRIAELEARLSQVEHRDPLTGSLLSQRAFRTQLELDVARADRYARPLSIALIDVDRFRQLNLEHGYPAGDAVLGGLGHLVAEETRMNDLACRMGGDEFAILFGETDAAEALAAVQRILLKLEELEVGAIKAFPCRSESPACDPGRGPRRCWLTRVPPSRRPVPRAAVRPSCMPTDRPRRRPVPARGT